MVVLLVTGLALAASACAGQSGRQVDQPDQTVGLTTFTPSQRVSVPALSGRTLTGQSLTTSTYAGRSPLVINVWASWCSPCRQEVPLLARAARLGVHVLGIDERDSTARAASFADQRGVAYPSLEDPDGHLLSSLRLLPRTGIPSTLFVAADGRVAARVVGPLTRSTLRRALKVSAS
jgi:thiol-disulfide isomerase/thioredoxin